jgi:hypothetical protein
MVYDENYFKCVKCVKSVLFYEKDNLTLKTFLFFSCILRIFWLL